MTQNAQNFLDSYREYDKKTNEDQHSDTGTLWELLHWAAEIIEGNPNEIQHTAPSIILSRIDIDELGYDSSNLSNEEFNRIADKAGEYSMENWWQALETLLEEYQVPVLEDSHPA